MKNGMQVKSATKQKTLIKKMVRNYKTKTGSRTSRAGKNGSLGKGRMNKIQIESRNITWKKGGKSSRTIK